MNTYQPTSLEVPPDEMRAMGYQVIDMLVDRYANLRDSRVWTGSTRAELDVHLKEAAPAEGIGFNVAFNRLISEALPFGARVDHPAFMAFVPGAPTWPAILGDLIATGTNTFQGTWLASAGASEIEIVVIDWFREWLGLDSDAGGILVSGGSAANLTALATARIVRCGSHDDRSTLYCSAETHSSVTRAARTLGFSDERVVHIPVDEAQCIDVSLLRSSLERDIARRLQPLAVIANAGTTSTGAIDDLTAIADLCADFGTWLHVDAAYGGFAALTDRGRAALAGIEYADSIALDPHKWLYQPFEAGCLLVRDASVLDMAFNVMPAYLQDTALPGAAGDGADGLPLPVNFANRGIQLSRAARAIKIWLSIQTFGVDAFRAAIDRCIDVAAHAERRIRASAELEILSPAQLGIVCFRIRASAATVESLNRDALDALLHSGRGMISSTRVGDSFALRLCILNYRTDAADVERVIEWFEDYAARCR